MAFGSEQWMYSTGFYPYEIGQSLRFNDDDSAYLSRTPATTGNRKTWTWSGWVKRGNTGGFQTLFQCNGDGNYVGYVSLMFLNDALRLYNKNSISSDNYITTSAVYRDCSSWYHIVAVLDTANATASERAKLYVNGEQITSFSTAIYPPLDFEYDFNLSGNPHAIGRDAQGSTYHFDGYMAEVNFIDGQALDATDFGEFKSGVWIPKSYSGTYGTNGFYLPFKNPTIANETDSAIITAPFGGIAANGKEPDGNFVTSNTTTGSAFTLLHYDLGSAKNIQEYVIKGLSFTGGTSTFQVQYSTDNSSWIAATSLSVTSSSQDFAAGWNVTARYWRIRATAFGTNGTASVDSFQLFSGEIGIDDSGNNNDFSSRRLLLSDILLDSPTNSFATLNALINKDNGKGTGTFAEGNLSFTGEDPSTASTINPDSGKYYWEVYLLEGGPNGFLGDFGLSAGYSELFQGIQGAGIRCLTSNTQTFVNSTAVATASTPAAVGDVVSFAWDVDSQLLSVYLRNSIIGSALSVPNDAVLISFLANGGSGNSSTHVANFGQDSSFAGNRTRQGNTDARGIGDFYYAPPEGYLALCTANLPDPVIDPAQDDVPEDYFNTVLYNGNNSFLRSITGVGFQPDFVWLKSRTDVLVHGLTDVVRGATRALYTNLTNAETVNEVDGYLSSFDSDGFTLEAGTSSNATFNRSGDAYVSWNWKADGTGVTNTDGSITSTVSANQKAGFSVVSYTGNGAVTDQTVGHGLSGSEMVIVKNRSSATDGNWRVAHSALSPNYNLALNLTVAEFDVTASTHGGIGTLNATSNTFTLKKGGSGTNNTNQSGVDYIAYCFTSVDGYSKFGSYTGNASADGPFVYTGFRPAFVLVKSTQSTNQWYIYDTKRDLYNPEQSLLIPNSSGAEFAWQHVDFLSNGFKIKSDNWDWNYPGKIIYMAFAEMPFKYANAR